MTPWPWSAIVTFVAGVLQARRWGERRLRRQIAAAANAKGEVLMRAYQARNGPHIYIEPPEPPDVPPARAQ